jgi:cysteinyl-tRNA synthetase
MKLLNSLSSTKEFLHPHKPDTVSMYVCGITPYDFAHVGHGRSAVAFDVLYRTLQFLGYNVIYCRNFTDIDDKLIARAQREFGDGLRYHEVAQRFMNAYTHDMERLHCLRPTHEPLVTAHIKEIIAFVQGLIDADKAYVVDHDVYYHIDSFHEYGKLSKQKIDELRAGARVEPNDKKEDLLDFALWKGEEEGTFFKSPWGWGRPGWHIECSALAATYLGKHIDIHGGGMDLLFPHHENEIAQSEGLFGPPFVQYWVHNAFVRINKEKMSKSLGNFFTLRDVFEKVHPVLLRFYFLNHHYRAPLDFTFEDIESLHKAYQRLCRVLSSCEALHISSVDMAVAPIGSKLLAFLTDDLNTPGMFGVIFEYMHELESDAQSARIVKYLLQHILGLPLQSLPERSAVMTPEIRLLLDARQAAREAKDWARADLLRDQLLALGWQVQDKKAA